MHGTKTDDTPNEVGSHSEADATPFGTKLKPISVFSASECSSRADLAKICFTASPVPSAASSLSYSSSASLVGTDMNGASDNGRDVGVDALLQVNFASTSSRDVILFEHSFCCNPAAILSGAMKLGQCQPEREKSALKGEVMECPSRSDPVSSGRPLKPILQKSNSLGLPAVSRTGRENQRFETCSETGRLIRLVTGTVPITNHGAILFVSAAKKREWILPKGGWELDETIEESALRETFEEAGVFGTLGPRLCDVVYETRKGRKRRLEETGPLATAIEQVKTARTSTTDGSKIIESHGLSQEPSPKDQNVISTTGISSVASTTSGNSSEEDEPLSLSLSAFDHQDATSITATKAPGGQSCLRKVENESNLVPLANALPVHVSMCRMALFPLYISEVLEEWPESGRSRKIVPLDEAIQMSQREEIRQVLEEVKRRGLHQPTFDSE